MPQAYDLRKQIDHLKSLEGEGTELVTITVPPDKSLSSLRERVQQEYAGAENIKSDKTRERVQQALSRIQRILWNYKETPENGIVVYAGVIDGELVSYSFDVLPEPVSESTYRCDDHFDLTALIDATTPDDTFGLIVIERGGAAVGRLVGERIVPIRTVESQVMGKTRAGGQSAQRFKRERERQKHEFFQKVATIANDGLSADGEIVTGLAVGGTLATVKEFVNGEYLDHRLQDRILGTYSVEYGNVQGLHQIVDKAASQILDAERKQERELLGEFFRRLRDEETVAYGVDEVEKAIEYGAVDTAILSSEVPQDRRDEIQTGVDQQGGDTCVVSTETERGAQFAETFNGVGALLRYSVG